MFRHDCPLTVKLASTQWNLVKKNGRGSAPIDMFLSAVSVLVVCQLSSEVPEGLINNPVYPDLEVTCFAWIWELTVVISLWGTRWRSWLRHCATSRKFADSIPNYVIEIFHWHNHSGRTMALGLTQSLPEISTKNKDGRYIGLTTLPPSCADCLEIWESQLPGTLWVCPDL
jgi:hypothetical protein